MAFQKANPPATWYNSLLEPKPMTTPKSTTLRAIGLLLAGIILLARGLAFDFVSDDAFISLRYVQNFISGGGLVFNPGDKVEGFSNPLWVLSLSAFGRILGSDLLLLARVFGGAFAILTVVLTWATAKRAQDLLVGRMTKNEETKGNLILEVPPLVAALLVASNPPLACWSLAGLETSSHTFLIVLGFFFALGEWTKNKTCFMSATVCGFLALSRPEGILLGLGIVAATWFAHPKKSNRYLLTRCLVVVGFALSLHAFRWIYYGEIFPNTFYAKSGATLIRMEQGALYLLGAFMDHGGAIILPGVIILGLAMPALRKGGGLIFSTLALLQIAFVTQAGGDGLPMYRFVVPFIPASSLLLGLCLSWFLLRTSTPDRPQPARLGVLLLAVGYVIYCSADPQFGNQYRLYRDQKDVQIPAWTEAGQWLAKSAAPDDTLACVPVGAISYYSRLTVYDMLGLTDRHIAHSDPPGWRKRLNEEQRWAGHEKQDGKYIISRRPTFLLLGNIAVTDEPLDRNRKASRFIPYPTASWIKVWEYDVANHEDLDRLYQPQVVMLPSGKFFNFLKLRDDAR